MIVVDGDLPQEAARRKSVTVGVHTQLWDVLKKVANVFPITGNANSNTQVTGTLVVTIYGYW